MSGKKRAATESYDRAHKNSGTASPYCFRNRLLKEMGYKSYRDYLRSPKWASIRKQAILKNNGRCVSCGSPATQVHHSKYDKPTLTGQSLKFLHPVCGKCHENAEMDAGKKTTIFTANARLGCLTEGQISYWNPKGKYQKRAALKQEIAGFTLRDQDLESHRDYYVLWTSGSCVANQGGLGGWSFILRKNDKTLLEKIGRSSQTTVGQMEMTAALMGLLEIDQGSKTLVLSDSQSFVRRAISKRKRKKNHNIWSQIDAACTGRNVTWRWINGNASHEWNERCNALCSCDSLENNSDFGEVDREFSMLVGLF